MRIHHLALLGVSFVLMACSSSTSQDSGLQGPGNTQATADTNPYGVAYPTANIGYLARRGQIAGNVIQNYKFQGYMGATDGSAQTPTSGSLSNVALADFFDPQGKLGPNGVGIKIIHLSVAAVWCGPCNDETDQTSSVAASLTQQGVVFVQALDDGAEVGTPATQTDLNNWITKHKSNFTEMLDPGLKNLGQFFDAAAVPFNANIDARSMEILSAGVGEPQPSVQADVTHWLTWVGQNAASGS
ncbi:MAG: hypothetical protein ACRELY_06005 [Polyangiaceae bacterium]